MVYYVANILLMALFYFGVEKGKTFKNGRMAFCILASIQWILFVGLRNYEVFSDNIMYAGRFAVDQISTFSDIIPNPLTLSGGWGYDVFSHFIALFGFNYRGFLIILAAIYIGAFARFVYCSSPDCFTSFLMFATLMIFTALCPLRQSIAVVFSGILSFKYVEERRPIMFGICVLLGMLFHTSAIAIAPLYFCNQWKIVVRQPLLFVAIIIAEYLLVLAAPATGREIINTISGSDYEWYATHNHIGANTILFSVMYYALYALAVTKRKDYTDKGEAGLIALMLICFLLPFALLNSNVIRLSYYYMPLVTILLPMFFRTFSKQQGAVLKIGFFAAFVVSGVVFTAARAGMTEYIPVILLAT